MDLITRFDLIKKNIISYKSPPGYVGRVFEYYERSKFNKDGTLPIIINIEPEEKKKKKSIN
jgi:hypothetical protein